MHDNALLYRNDGLRITLNALIVILGAMGAGGILLAGDMNSVLGVIVAGMLFFLLSLMSRVRRLTDDGERLQANALALKEAGISSGSDLLPLLPYYVALDMTEPLVETIDTAPNGRYAGSNDPLPFYLYVGWHHSLHSLTSSMRDTHHHNASIPNPDSASSSSHGGGGSNGGGGGHGAW